MGRPGGFARDAADIGPELRKVHLQASAPEVSISPVPPIRQLLIEINYELVRQLAVAVEDAAEQHPAQPDASHERHDRQKDPHRRVRRIEADPACLDQHPARRGAEDGGQQQPAQPQRAPDDRHHDTVGDHQQPTGDQLPDRRRIAVAQPVVERPAARVVGAKHQKCREQHARQQLARQPTLRAARPQYGVSSSHSVQACGHMPRSDISCSTPRPAHQCRRHFIVAGVPPVLGYSRWRKDWRAVRWHGTGSHYGLICCRIVMAGPLRPAMPDRRDFRPSVTLAAARHCNTHQSAGAYSRGRCGWFGQ